MVRLVAEYPLQVGQGLLGPTDLDQQVGQVNPQRRIFGLSRDDELKGANHVRIGHSDPSATPRHAQRTRRRSGVSCVRAPVRRQPTVSFLCRDDHGTPRPFDRTSLSPGFQTKECISWHYPA
jgi:hypothetical protein